MKKLIIAFFLILLVGTLTASYNKNYSGDNMGNCKAKRDVDMRNFDIQDCDGLFVTTTTVSVIDMVEILEEPEEHRTGRMFWNPSFKTLSIMSDIEGFALNVGQHSWIKVRNISGSVIGKGKVVYQSGIQGQLPTVDLAISSDCTKCEVLGVTADSIIDNENGFVILSGEISDVNTGDYDEGDTLYLSTSTAGEFVTVSPSYPYYAIKIGRVLYSSSSKGKITVDTGVEQTNLISINNVDVFGTVYNGTINITDGFLTGATTIQSANGDFTDLYVSTITPKSPLFINNEANDVLFTGTGNVAIGTSDARSKLEINGGILKTGSTSYATFQDTINNLGFFSYAGGQYDTISGGYNNSTLQSTVLKYNTICGGLDNYIDGICGFIGGGENNSVNVGEYSAQSHSTICGGKSNTTTDLYSFVGGGNSNNNTGYNSAIVGGYLNSGSGDYYFIGNGFQNVCDGNYSSIIGGKENTASGAYSLASGDTNNAGGNFSFAIGKYMNLTSLANNTFVYGIASSSQTIDTSNAFLIFPAGESGKVGIGTPNPTEALEVSSGSIKTNFGIIASTGVFSSSVTISGSLTGATTVQANIGDFIDVYVSTINTKSPLYINNTSNDVLFTGTGNVAIGTSNARSKLEINGGILKTGSTSYATFQDTINNLGFSSYAGGQYDTISGGYNNSTLQYSPNKYNAICGGLDNYIDGIYGFIGGGEDNSINVGNYNFESHSTICGGKSNITTELYSFVGGGHSNNNTGYNSAIVGGYLNSGSGSYYFIGNGFQNVCDGNYSSIIGGKENTASGAYSFASGDTNNAGGNFSFAIGKYMNLTSLADNTFVYGIASSSQTIDTSNAFLIFPAGESGKVGIGTPNPTEALEVSSGSIKTNFGIIASTGVFSSSVTISGSLTEATTVQANIGDFNDIYVSSIHAKSELNIIADSVNISSKAVVSEKLMFTTEGGIAIRVTNKTGASSTKGYLVSASSTTDNAVSLFQVGSPDIAGIIYEDGVSDGDEMWIVVNGIADVFFSTSTTRGHFARGCASGDINAGNGKAFAEAVPVPPFATNEHFQEIGHVNESRTGEGLAKTIIHFN